VSQIPEQQPLTPEQAFAQLQVWYGKKQELANLKASEVLLRKDMATFYFPSPNVGTNRLDIGGGYDLKLVFKYNISVDEAAVDQVTAAQIKKHKLPWEELFVYKPSLVRGVYDALTEDQRKFVDKLLNIKDATPDLDIVPRANYEAAQAHAEAAVAEQRILGVDDPDDAKPGDYYEDGEGQWWLALENGEWTQCADPNLEAAPEAPPAKPKRTRAKAK
jgi:hypothetical protein